MTPLNEMLREVEQRLLVLLARCQGLLPQEALEQMRSLTEVGEPGVALEFLSEALDESDLRVDPSIVDEIEAIGTRMGIDPKYWNRLR